MALPTTSFTVGEILIQLKEDLWCKEVATGYTVSYTWCANQLGHFAIGFAPTILIASIGAAFWGLTPWLGLVGLIPAVWMVRKEQGDIRAEQARWTADPGIEALNLDDVRHNAWTSDLFTIVGAVVGASPYCAELFPAAIAAVVPLFTLLACCIPCWFVLRYWMMKKMVFQRGALPFTYRLSYFPARRIPEAEAARAALARFQAGGLDHLVVAGGANTGKTSLITAIGTELGFRRVKVRYIELLDFLDIAPQGRETPVHFAYVRWPWEDAVVLVIDDVGDIALVRRLAEPAYAAVLARLRGKKLVWAIEDPARVAAFAELLREVFGEGSSAAIVLAAPA